MMVSISDVELEFEPGEEWRGEMEDEPVGGPVQGDPRTRSVIRPSWFVACVESRVFRR